MGVSSLFHAILPDTAPVPAVNDHSQRRTRESYLLLPASGISTAKADDSRQAGLQALRMGLGGVVRKAPLLSVPASVG
jgi:hypothetical protein